MTQSSAFSLPPAFHTPGNWRKVALGTRSMRPMGGVREPALSAEATRSCLAEGALAAAASGAGPVGASSVAANSARLAATTAALRSQAEATGGAAAAGDLQHPGARRYQRPRTHAGTLGRWDACTDALKCWDA